MKTSQVFSGRKAEEATYPFKLNFKLIFKGYLCSRGEAFNLVLLICHLSADKTPIHVRWAIYVTLLKKFN